MTVTLGILALLEAKAGKGDELAAFLKAGRDLAVAEEGTVTWYAFKISDTSYGIFDTFVTGDARTAHINGQIPAALAEVSADLPARAPDIQPVSLPRPSRRRPAGCGEPRLTIFNLMAEVTDSADGRRAARRRKLGVIVPGTDANLRLEVCSGLLAARRDNGGVLEG